MTIPFRVKLLTPTAKEPHRNCESDLWDLFADDFCAKNLSDFEKGGFYLDREDNPGSVKIYPGGRILVKTGIGIELPNKYESRSSGEEAWKFEDVVPQVMFGDDILRAYAVADLRPRSGLALKHGVTVLNTPGTIDNTYRKEIGVILINHGHEPYIIKKGDKIAQMLIRPLYPSKMEVVSEMEITERGAYGSSGK